MTVTWHTPRMERIRISNSKRETYSKGEAQDAINSDAFSEGRTYVLGILTGPLKRFSVAANKMVSMLALETTCYVYIV